MYIKKGEEISEIGHKQNINKSDVQNLMFNLQRCQSYVLEFRLYPYSDLPRRRMYKVMNTTEV